MRFSKETLAAAVAAVGCAGFAMDVDAAPLDTNLVVNGGFENVDGGTTGAYGAVLILDWSHSGSGAFAYTHDGSLGAGDYANGGSYTGPAYTGGGSFYFTGGSANAAQGLANALTQTIDVSTGDTGAAIAAGTAFVNLSAIFSGYSVQDDHGLVTVEQLDSGGGVLASTTITPGGNVQAWTSLSDSAAVNTNTTAIRVSVYASAAFAGGSSDGYVDNVDVQISNVPEPGSLALLGLGGLAILRRRRG